MIQISIPKLPKGPNQRTRVFSRNIRQQCAIAGSHDRTIRKLIYEQLRETGAKAPNLPVVVTITRQATRPLDDDNFIAACKIGVRDSVANWLIPGLPPGKADGDERIDWVYRQVKGKPSCLIIQISSTKDAFDGDRSVHR